MNEVRTTRVVGLALLASSVIVAAVAVVIGAAWEEPDAGLTTLGIVVAALLGGAGVISAVVWRNRVTAQAATEGRLLPSFLVVAALADASLVGGFALAFVARSLAPLWVGAAAFALAMAVSLTALSQIDG